MTRTRPLLGTLGVALVADRNGRVLGYVCDSRQTAAWFHVTVAAGGRVDLAADGQVTVELAEKVRTLSSCRLRRQ